MNANLKCNAKRPDHPYEGASFLKRWTFWWEPWFFVFSLFPCTFSLLILRMEINCSFSSRISGVRRWLKDLFKLGLQRPIENEDIYRTLKEHECTRLSDHFETLWDEERKKRQPRLLTVIRQVYAKKIIGISILFTAIDAISRYVLWLMGAKLCVSASLYSYFPNSISYWEVRKCWVWFESVSFIVYRAIQPQCLGSLVMYFSQTKENAATSEDPRLVYLYAVGIILCSILTISFSHPFMVYALQMGMRVRITCCSLIYRKVSSRCIYSKR